MSQTNEVPEGTALTLGASPALVEAIGQALNNPGMFGDLTIFSGLEGLGVAAEAVAGGGALEAAVPAAALEAIVRRVGRPPLLVTNQRIQLVPLPDFPEGTDSLIKGTERLVGSVGRVEFINHAMAWGGTGWVISAEGDARVIATNRHVAALVANRAADGHGVFLRAPASGVRYGAAVDFGEELERTPGSPLPVVVTDVVYLADEMSPDVALLKVVGDQLPSPMELAGEEATQDELVALIGYPAFDPRNDREDQAKYFRDLYGVKRFAPGKVIQPLGPQRLLTHDCTSLGGNSGSPLIRLSDGKVVGLHFSGVYGVANSAVGVTTLRDILAGKPQGPLSTRAGTSEPVSDGSHDAAYFAGRGGYKSNFLKRDLDAPWPGLPDTVKNRLAVPAGNQPHDHELRYTHFGVKYDQVRRQPLMTAVNIDGARTVRIKRTRDRWFFDGRVPREVQLSENDYGDKSIDRGHMVRREDPNWGTDVEGEGDDIRSRTASIANDDTFHYVNAALQSSTLNQRAHLWQGLEKYLLDSARTEGFKLCVFTGPVLRDDDPELAPGLAVPLEFWKLAVMVDAEAGGLHATAYLLSQGDLIRDLLERRSRTEAVEGFVLGAYRTFQIAVRDLADALGYDFSEYVDADPLAKAAGGREDVGSTAPVFLSIEAESELVL